MAERVCWSARVWGLEVEVEGWVEREEGWVEREGGMECEWEWEEWRMLCGG